jgi:hypothetical protein
MSGDCRRHDPIRLPDTRVDVLNEISAWADGEEEQCVFWLNGMAGTGKSTITRTVARKYSEQSRLAASFFFSRDAKDAHDSEKLFSTLARQLGNVSPALCRYICEAISNYKEIATPTLRDQWTQLILRPLSKVGGELLKHSLITMIDVLDECEGDDNIRLLLRLLSVANCEIIWLRVFITSRLDPPIRLRFRAVPGILHHKPILDNLSRTIVDNDIAEFLEFQFREIRESFNYLPANWLEEEILGILVPKVGGLFMYAATVCRFIKTNNKWPPQQLLEAFFPQQELDSPHGRQRKVPSKSPTAGLDAIYTHISKHFIKGVKEEDKKEDLAREFKQVIGSIVILSETLSAAALGRLLAVDQEITT